MKKNLFIFGIGAPALALLMVMIRISYLIFFWGSSGSELNFTIRPGETFSQINYRLSKQNLISSSQLFHRLCQSKEILTKFKSGDYIIQPGTNMLDIATILTSGSSLTIRVTIPEGQNLYQIAKQLEKKGITQKQEFITASFDQKLLRQLRIDSHSVEGHLYPETYNFSKNVPASYVIKSMVAQFRREMDSLGYSIENPLPHHILILASIVEKETGAGHERPRIAGVFHNRLKRKMRLQSDPTTIYGIYQEYKGNLKKRHLKMRTPYNTYQISGLPKGPISNPGLEAIRAALEPERHSFLYFVSRNDGTHLFTRTYKEHLQGVDKFQKRRKYRKGRSWRDLKKKKLKVNRSEGR
ncbi:MAG: endolytic transglycosylase MltG [Bdellovibrionales bacterium]|jgi:UPF0755 protein|nr:endolytic transglycosylase MltG [Bdellovibrionales bacterium]MBT3525839.1 endolytic transglycosylase MltG [Bdellovibrionales bacterium]MBT7670291.1 endolytic transglycosylase MltG [Bdellovibrionales bacterium]MBT7765670.1 endolytic transglycosylase MltG [Bdellovibrionales bacterium]